MGSPAWLIGSLVEGALDGHAVKLYRVVYIQPAQNIVFLLHVEQAKTPHSTCLPKGHVLDSAQRRLRPVAECIRLAEMEEPDERIASLVDGRDRRFGLIEPLVRTSVLPGLMHRKQRQELIKQQALATNVQGTQLRKLLTRYWWYGCDKNALLELRALQGGPGKVRCEPGPAKRGRRNALVREQPETKLKGVNVNKRHLEIFAQALELYWIAENATLSETYSRMEHHLFRRTVSKPDGTAKTYQISKRHIPSRQQFVYHARRIIAAHGLRRHKLSELDYMSTQAGRFGSARDIADGPGDVFDIDATEFDFELVASWDATRRIGKPTTYLVIDRSSTAIVGFHCEPCAERWEGYRRALYSAFTPKDGMLKRCGLWEDFGNIWPFHAVPNAVFSDRGPARSNDALKALCKELGLEKAASPTRRPDLNAVVESFQKKVQARVSLLPGAYKQGRDERSRQRASAARRSAQLDKRAFMACAVAAICDHNQSSSVPHLLTAPMIKAAVKAVPQDIFLWGLSNSAVDYLRHRDPVSLYAKLLPSREAAVYPSGVRYNHARYNSQRLQSWRQQFGRKSPKITVYIDADPFYLYWQPSGGQWEELVMSAADQARFDGMGWADIERHLQKIAADAIEVSHARHRRGILSRTQEKILRDIQEAGGGASAFQPGKQSVATNRTFEARKQRATQQKEGRSTMEKLTQARPALLPPPSDKPAPVARHSGEEAEPTLAEMRARFFKTTQA